MARALVNNRRASGSFNLSNFYISGYSSGDTNCHQGITTDGTNLWGIHTSFICRFNNDWSLDFIGPDGSAQLGVTHFGDGQYYNGKIYIVCEDYVNETTFSNMKIAVFNSTTLALETTYDVTAQAQEVSGLCIDPVNGIVYVSNFVQGTSLNKYNLSDMSYIGQLKLAANAYHTQGITYKDGEFFINCNPGGGGTVAELHRVDATTGALIEKRRQYIQPGGQEGIDFTTDRMLWLSDPGDPEIVTIFDTNGTGRKLVGATTNSLLFKNTGNISTTYTLPANGTVFCRIRMTTDNIHNTVWDTSGDSTLWQTYIHQNGSIQSKTSNATVSGNAMPGERFGSVWKSVAFTWTSGGSSICYVDGEDLGTITTVTDGNSGTTFYWGGGSTSASWKFRGYMSDGRIYSQALTQKEVMTLHRTGIDPYAPEIKHLMNEGSGTTANDSSGNGRNGTILNGTWSTFTHSPARTAVTGRTAV